jgi:hypothetical protein
MQHFSNIAVKQIDSLEKNQKDFCRLHPNILYLNKLLCRSAVHFNICTTSLTKIKDVNDIEIIKKFHLPFKEVAISFQENAHICTIFASKYQSSILGKLSDGLNEDSTILISYIMNDEVSLWANIIDLSKLKLRNEKLEYSSQFMPLLELSDSDEIVNEKLFNDTCDKLGLALHLSLEFLLTLNVNDIKIVDVVPSEKLNKKRIKNDKIPFSEFKILTVKSKKVVMSSSIKCGHNSPRFHSRRGHERRLKSGRIVWVKDCKIGKPDKGSIITTYSLK